MSLTKIKKKSSWMKKQIIMGQFMVLTIVFIAVAITAPSSWAEEDGEESTFDEAHLYFELNDTDGDLGIHSLIDGEPWKKLQITAPSERKMLDIKVKGKLRKQGLTEVFFESAEPSFDELEPEKFFNRFPEGEYEIEGITLEGDELESTAVLTHVLPAPPENIMISGIPAAEDCDADELPVISDPVVISWDAVTKSHPELGRTGESTEVTKYQVVVEREEPELIIFSVDLPSSVTEVTIPSEFIDLSDEFKFEILVREETGNQTAVESCFIVD